MYRIPRHPYDYAAVLSVNNVKLPSLLLLSRLKCHTLGRLPGTAYSSDSSKLQAVSFSRVSMKQADAGVLFGRFVSKHVFRLLSFCCIRFSTLAPPGRKQEGNGSIDLRRQWQRIFAVHNHNNLCSHVSSIYSQHPDQLICVASPQVKKAVRREK